jgi:hypothetical protein
LADSRVQVIWLEAENNDIAAGSDSVTLGRAPIESDGSWKGQWQILSDSNLGTKEINISIPPACAVLIKANIQ